MRWADREAIGLFENIKNGVQVTDNYGRLIHNFENRGNSWRNREVVGLLTKIRDGVDVADNYGRLIHNFENRGNSWGNATMVGILGQARDAAGGSSPQELTNAEKLALPIDTAVGTVVHVTDGFVVSGAPYTGNFFFADGGTHNGKPTYSDVNGNQFLYDGTEWSETLNGGIAVTGNENFPWQADFLSSFGYTFTHPAVQQLASPSTAQGAVFVLGGTQDGLYVDMGDISYSKKVFGLLGVNTGIGDPASAIYWIGDVTSDYFSGAGPGTPSFVIADGGDPPNLLYYSVSDVATPDLAGSDAAMLGVSGSGIAYASGVWAIDTSYPSGMRNGKRVYYLLGHSQGADWLLSWEPNLNDTLGDPAPADPGWVLSATGGSSLYSTSAVATPDLASGWTALDAHPITISFANVSWVNPTGNIPANITVTSLTVGDIVSGNKLGSVVRVVNGATSARNKYTDVLAVATDLTWDGSKWTDGTTNGSTNTAIPDIGTGDPVASESNWTVVL